MMWCPLWKTTWGRKRTSHQGNGEGQNLLTPLHAKQNLPRGKAFGHNWACQGKRGQLKGPGNHTLEEKIERLSQSITRDRPNICTPSRSQDWWRKRSKGQSRRWCRAFPEGSPTHSPTNSPPGWEGEEAKPPSLEFDLGSPSELEPNVECFFQGPAGKWGDEGHHLPVEPPVDNYEKWVEWRGQMVDTPSWWRELEEILDIEDTQELAQKIWASFELPWWTNEVYGSENYHLPLPAPKCLHWKNFLPMPDPRFSCWDIWEEQQTKTITYAQALQYWAERANPPMLGQAHLLARSVLDLRKMMERYISFSDDTVLGSVALPEGFFSDKAKLTTSTNVLPASTGGSSPHWGTNHIPGCTGGMVKSRGSP